MDDGIQIRIKEFKDDLINMAISETEIVRKHLSFGTPYIFQDSEAIYFNLKKDIADFFNSNPSKIFMVGSAKLGFSIAPRKIWREIQDESDIDMVIVSNEIFEKYWKELFRTGTKEKINYIENSWSIFLKDG